MLEKVEGKRLEDRVIDLPGKPPCMLDRDLARIYGVETKRLNETRERNPKKFREGVDYFRLTKEEVANCDHLGEADKYRGSPFYIYTKTGAFMFSTILNTDQAIKHAIAVVEGFCTYSLLMEEIKAGRITMKPTSGHERTADGYRFKALCFKGRHIHLVNYGRYGEVAMVKEVTDALGLKKGNLRDRARAHPEVRASITLLEGEELSLFKAVCKSTGIRVKASKAVAICPVELLSNLLLYGRTGKEELELHRLVNGYLMGTQPAAEITPYRRLVQGQLSSNN